MGELSHTTEYSGSEAAESTAESGKVKARFRWDLLGLLGLTVFSGFLCFNRLSVPSMLIDECFTYWRTCGSLGDLLDTLRNDAFMPLHYELLNWVRQGFPLGWGYRVVPGGIWLTPTAMRFFPAMCGTAMTPVMYFLGRQLFNRRTALIAAAFIACSGYGLFFSRNAKMYMPAWMLETLSIACFLWWVRTWKRVAWLWWIWAGIAAAGFHAIVLLLLPLSPLYFLSVGKFRGWRAPMLVIGMGIILVGPGIYYGFYNRWTEKSGGLVPGVVGEPAPDANWGSSGLNWLEAPENSVGLPFRALNNYLSGFDWGSFDDLANPAPLVQRYSKAMIALAAVTYGLFVLGAMPNQESEWERSRRLFIVRGGKMVGKSGQLESPDRQGAVGGFWDGTVQPWWRNLLWISLWIVLPVYGCFYCRSVEDFNSPVDWVRAGWEWVGVAWPWAAAGMIVLAAGLHFLPREAAGLLGLALFGLWVAAVVQSARNHLEWVGHFDSYI